MNREKEAKLFQRFAFFRPDRPPQAGLMCFGFECGDGWFDLLWRLCEDIERLLQPDNTFEVVQVKEKFGGLRFYCYGATDAIYERIGQAESESYVTCETCGKPGRERDTAWIQTLCDECYGRVERRG